MTELLHSERQLYIQSESSAEGNLKPRVGKL